MIDRGSLRTPIASDDSPVQQLESFMLFRTQKPEPHHALRVSLTCPQSQFLIRTFTIKRVWLDIYIGFFPHRYLGTLDPSLPLFRIRRCFYSPVARLFAYCLLLLKRGEIRKIALACRQTLLLKKQTLKDEIENYFRVVEELHEYRLEANSTSQDATPCRRADLGIQAIPGNRAFSSSRICYFSHYDANSIVDPYVLYYLDALLKLDFAIVFISTNPELDQGSVLELKGRCSQIILRKNIGLDFGSWAIGLLNSPISNPSTEVLFANDSVFGPLFDLDQVLMAYRDSQADLFGITDSQEIESHLQSYFLLCSARFTASESFQTFWKSFVIMADKDKIVRKYEIGLSEIGRKSGFKLHAYCPFQGLLSRIEEFQIPESDLLRLRTSQAFNPTYFFWKPMIQKFRMPFIKRDLLVSNPKQVSEVSTWKSVIEKESDYPTDLIQDYLTRVGASRFPSLQT